MPTKPKTHKPAGFKTKQQKQKIYDDRRGSSHSRGYNARWRKARQVWLDKYPWCAYCLLRNRFEAANVVDHIIPHKGDMKLFWDQDNWQSLDKKCHDRKTMRELNDKPMEVFLICGPAGSGKTTFVKKYKKDNDLVYDYDAVASALTFTGERREYVNCVNLLVRIREFLTTLIRQRQECFKDIRRMWFISSEADAAKRARIAGLLNATRVLVLETTVDQCIENVRLSPERKDRLVKIEKQSKDWWHKYKPNDTDLALQWGEHKLYKNL